LLACFQKETYTTSPREKARGERGLKEEQAVAAADANDGASEKGGRERERKLRRTRVKGDAENRE